jgi:hypothetical protein
LGTQVRPVHFVGLSNFAANPFLEPILIIMNNNSIETDTSCIVFRRRKTGEVIVAQVKEKPIWKFKVTGEHQTSTKSTTTARGKTYIVDEPIQRGGTDLGPMPVEYVFMGLVGCTHVISNCPSSGFLAPMAA